MPRKKNKSLFDSFIESLFPTPEQLAVRKANKKWKHMPTGNNSQRSRTIKISEENNQTFLIEEWSDTNFQTPSFNKKRINWSSPKNLETPRADLAEQAPNSNVRQRENNIEFHNSRNYFPVESTLTSNNFSTSIEENNEELIFGNSDATSSNIYQWKPDEPNYESEFNFESYAPSNCFALSSTSEGSRQESLNWHRQGASSSSEILSSFNNQKKERETGIKAFQSHLNTTDSSDYYCLVSEV